MKNRNNQKIPKRKKIKISVWIWDKRTVALKYYSKIVIWIIIIIEIKCIFLLFCFRYSQSTDLNYFSFIFNMILYIWILIYIQTRIRQLLLGTAWFGAHLFTFALVIFIKFSSQVVYFTWQVRQNQVDNNTNVLNDVGIQIINKKMILSNKFIINNCMLY